MVGWGEVTVGETVFAYWQPFEGYFVATIVEQTDKGYCVVYEDGDVAELPPAQIVKFNIQAQMQVFARWTDGQYYPGRIGQTVGRASFIHYEDGDQCWVPLAWIAVKP